MIYETEAKKILSNITHKNLKNRTHFIKNGKIVAALVYGPNQPDPFFVSASLINERVHYMFAISDNDAKFFGIHSLTYGQQQDIALSTFNEIQKQTAIAV